VCRLRLRLRRRRTISTTPAMSLLQNLKDKMQAPPRRVGLEPGHFQFMRREGEGKKNLHLRIDADGCGTLIVNASRVYHFNPSAAFMAFHLLHDEQPAEVQNEVVRNFKVPKGQAQADVNAFLDKFLPIIDPLKDACPICDLDLDVLEPFSKPPSIPYRMDLALTYRCNNACSHCYNDPQRSPAELTSAEWKGVLDKLWKIGIPHVVFTGGEPTLREDLPELVSHAQQLGLVTGINTNGRQLRDRNTLNQLVEAGLDHVQITLESQDAAIHDAIVRHPGAWQQTVAGIRNAVESRLFVMTNTTLLKSNTTDLEKTLQFLSDLRVPTIGLNGLIHSGRGSLTGEGIREEELPDLLALATFFTQTHQQRLIWYTPTQYCRFDPVTSGLGVKGCTAALYNLCIEPDGSVLPCQSYYQTLGNIHRDDWKSIWEHPLARDIRARHSLQEKCKTCNLLAECGGGCPLSIEQDAEKPMQVTSHA
jgi:radical SAM protein with 4Fe4S-binding SPASM domain